MNISRCAIDSRSPIPNVPGALKNVVFGSDVYCAGLARRKIKNPMSLTLSHEHSMWHRDGHNLLVHFYRIDQDWHRVQVTGKRWVPHIIAKRWVGDGPNCANVPR